MADDDTVASAKRGDPEAWQTLYREHAGRLLLWLRTRPVGDAAVSSDDLAAEAWMTAARRLLEFTGSSDDFAGWLFGIARNVHANQARRGKLRAHRGLETLVERPAPGPGPDVAIPGVEWVRAVLAMLPRRERDVLGCMEVVGLDAESTARALGISAVAVRVTRHRALRRLRGVLGSQSPPGTVSTLLALTDLAGCPGTAGRAQ